MTSTEKTILDILGDIYIAVNDLQHSQDIVVRIISEHAKDQSPASLPELEACLVVSSRQLGAVCSKLKELGLEL